VLRAVPATAIAQRGAERVVFTVDDNRAKAIPVKGRALDDGFFALEEGPDEGTPVIEQVSDALHDGAAIRLSAASS
jgi:hypothetical protein